MESKCIMFQDFLEHYLQWGKLSEKTFGFVNLSFSTCLHHFFLTAKKKKSNKGSLKKWERRETLATSVGTMNSSN